MTARQIRVHIRRLTRRERSALQTGQLLISLVRTRRTIHVVAQQLGNSASLPPQLDAADFPAGQQTGRHDQTAGARLLRLGQLTLVTRAVEGQERVSIRGQRLEATVHELAHIRSQRIDRHESPAPLFGPKEHEPLETGQFPTVCIPTGRAPAHYHLPQDILICHHRKILRRLGGHLVLQHRRPYEPG